MTHTPMTPEQICAAKEHAKSPITNDEVFIDQEGEEAVDAKLCRKMERDLAAALTERDEWRRLAGVFHENLRPSALLPGNDQEFAEAKARFVSLTRQPTTGGTAAP